MINFSRKQNILSQIILILVILANIYWLQSAVLGVPAGCLYLWINSKKISDILAKNIHQGLKNIIGFISILAYISIVYTIAYHLYQINIWIFIFLLVSIPLLVEILSIYFNTNHYFFSNFDWQKIKPQNISRSFLPTAVFLLDLLLFIVLFKKASLGIVRSPWELVGYRFWLVFLISNIFLVLSLIHKKSYKNIMLISWHFLLLASMAIILYPLGYGYDSFIHNATLKHISATGTIEPRLLLYIGQYGLSFFVSHIMALSITTANKVLLPVLFAVLWPSTLFYGLKYGLSWSFKNSYLATLWSLFVGFGFAIMTTPQSLSYLLAAVFVFLLPEINRKKISIFFALLLSIMTITIHPLTGMPLLLFTGLLFVWRQTKNILWSKIINPIIYLLSAIILPSLFAIYQRLDGFAWQDIFNFNTSALLNLPSLRWFSTYSFPLDMIYNIGQNIVWIYALLILLGLYFIIKENKIIFFRKLLIFSSLLIINYLLAKVLLSFNLQIDYQKNDYIDRIYYLIIIFLLPIFLTAIYFIFNALNKQNLTQKTFILIVSLIFVVVGTYFSYPVYDRHGNSKNFNVSSSDLKTVRVIEENANGEDYIVLANQMVGVAAIDIYGFSRYYRDNFYYSMPLGHDNIYQNFLSMIENNASREQALEAMDKAGVNKLYFVINNYWHSAKQAISQAETTADSKIVIDQGVNTIFVYNR